MADNKKIEIHEESQFLIRLSNLAFRFALPLAIFLVILVLAGGLIFLIQPKYASIVNDIQQVNAEKAEKKEQMEKYLARLESYNAKYSALSLADRERVDHILPDDNNQEELFAHLETVAINQGVVLTGVKIVSGEAASSARNTQAAPGKIGLNRIKVTANFAGVDYQVMLKLLSVLETDLRFFDVDKVIFSPDQYTLGLEMTTYFYK